VVRAHVPLAFLVLAGCGVPSFPRLAKTHCPGKTVGLDLWTDGHAPCDMLAEDVREMTPYGARAGIWGADQEWSGFDAQFLDADPLPDSVAGAGSNALGRTVWHDGGGHVAVSTALGRHQARATLLHELLHAAYGEGDHCGWSRRYVELFSEYGDLGSFEDGCARVRCQGDRSGRNWSCTPL
jgi:hypothetical protein